MNNEFVDVRILDNFYQTSSFFPMPVVLVSTVAETGQTNLGPYSLCFPYIIAGEHAMILISAIQLGCSTLWSEDLNPGQVYQGVTVLNPFWQFVRRSRAGDPLSELPFPPCHFPPRMLY